MKTGFALTLIVLVLAFKGPSDGQLKNEARLLQGTWVVESAEFGGKPFDKMNGTKYTFTSDTLTVTAELKGETIMKGSYKLDPTKTPKHLDLVVKDKDGKEEITRTVYTLNGDEMRICGGGTTTSFEDGKERVENESRRPLKVESDPNRQELLLTLKRKK